MTLIPNRRGVIMGLLTAPVIVAANAGDAQTRTVWTAREAFDALQDDSARLIDIRTRDEWQETGVGAGIWPISMHEDGFADRLFAARELAGDRTVGLICATGGRSAALLAALVKAGYPRFADISEGMLGSYRGPGWLATGLPVVPMDSALAALPKGLA